MELNNVSKFMVENKSSYDCAFDCAVDAVSFFSLWEDNRDICGGEFDIPQEVIELAERLFGEKF